MSYQVLARKWRPQSFEEVAGQQHIIRALSNTLKLQRLHHAYLFCGTRGVGKTTLARILAKCFNCEQGPTHEPCGQCPACTQINEGCFIDLIEFDAASHTGVDDMREIIDSAQYMPSSGRFKIYLIDEVHMLSVSSFNALLKTLEEPPEHIKFFFATTHPQKLPVTILSRCLQFHLKRLGMQELQSYLAKQLESEQVPFEQEALRQIAISAEGSVRDALSLLDHAIVHGGGELRLQELEAMLGIVAQQEPLELLRCLESGDATKLIKKIDEMNAAAVDFSSVLASLLTLFHELSLTQAVPDKDMMLQFKQEDLRHFAGRIPAEDLQLFYQIAVQGRKDLPFLPSAKNAFEMTLLRMLSFRPLSEEQLNRDSKEPLSVAETVTTKRSGAASAGPTQQKKTNKTAALEQPQAQSKAQSEVPAEETQTQPQKISAERKSQLDLASICDAQRWKRLMIGLELQGALKEFCDRTTFEYVPPDQVILTSDPKSWILYHEKYADKLSKMIGAYAGRPVQLEIRKGELEQATPFQVNAAEQQRCQIEHEETVRQNPTIRALQDELDAQIVSTDMKNPLSE